MTRPRLYLVRMALFVLVVAAITALLRDALQAAFVANLPLNVTIAVVLLVGILYIFRQVWMLTPEVVWIEGFRTGRQGLSEPMPRLMAPMAAMIGDRSSRRLSLSPVSMRTLLDGIAARLDEHRETSRYLIGVLVFLGLLGTFYGLLVTVHAVGGVIGGLTVSGGDLGRTMEGLKASLQAPLHGMATAFSSSLFGLAGSLVLGFLDLQAGQAQNRFFNELEEWLSGVTRLGGAGAVGDGNQPVPAYIQALLEQTADSLDSLQRIIARGEESRIAGNASFQAMSDRLGLLTEQMRAHQDVMLRLAEGQSDLHPVLARLAELPRSLAGGPGGLDEASRNHLRSLDQHVVRLVEEARGTREQTVQEIRTEIRLLARTIAALAETPAER